MTSQSVNTVACQKSSTSSQICSEQNLEWQPWNACHYISTSGCPVKVPPCLIPVHYREEVQRLLNDMLNQGIIEESSSPWMTPMVGIHKKAEEICLYVDYHELNKKMATMHTPSHYTKRPSCKFSHFFNTGHPVWLFAIASSPRQPC